MINYIRKYQGARQGLRSELNTSFLHLRCIKKDRDGDHNLKWDWGGKCRNGVLIFAIKMNENKCMGQRMKESQKVSKTSEQPNDLREV